MKESLVDINSINSSEDLLEKLRHALHTDGDFPTSARVVSELRSLASNPNTPVGKISEIILREPSLGTRVLHLVNSAYYQRTQPIETITQAITQLGMQPLSELCAGLVLMQRFIPAAKRGEVFADALKKSIIMSLLTTALAQEIEEEGVKERGYLAATFYNLGYLLLAYYFPQVYEVAASRAKARNHDVTQSLTEILGISPAELSLAIVDALAIPQYYVTIMLEAHMPPSQRTLDESNLILVSALSASEKIASNIVRKTGDLELKLTAAELAEVSGFSLKQLNNVICALPEQFVDHCKLVELGFLTLPNYLRSFKVEKEQQSKTKDVGNISSSFAKFTSEMKEAIQSREPLSSIITSVMETLAFGLKFHRVLLLLEDSSTGELVGRMALGNYVNFNPKEIYRKVDKDNLDDAPDSAAFILGSAQIFGDPIFEEGWPFVAIPIGGIRNKSIGVIYADIITRNDAQEQPLDTSTQASINIIADLLDEALSVDN